MNTLLKVITVIGNIAFIIWIANNIVNAGLSGSSGQLMSSVSLVVLLALNTSLLLRG